jgi:hypothetical protein
MNGEIIKGMAVVVALTFILGGAGLLFLKTVRMVLQHRASKLALQLEVLLKLVEQDAPVPPELLAADGAERVKGDLRRGLVLICSGVGLSAFLLTLGDHSAWGLGLIPIFTGIGFLLSAKLAQAD